MATALAFDPNAPLASEVSTTLIVGAGVGVRGLRRRRRDPALAAAGPEGARARRVTTDGRAGRVAFTRKLERGSLGYTLEYTYDPTTYTVTWATPRDSNVVLSRRGAVRPAVAARVPDAVPARDRSPDRRRPDRERARRPPGVARGRRVPRAPAPALLALAPTSTSPPRS